MMGGPRRRVGRRPATRLIRSVLFWIVLILIPIVLITLSKGSR